ncbi:hypothetical protein B0T14DRAFT_601616 [Immersiella caudata]|uniref:DUF7708 domain-containing protein n=1 Tax=Immersiella caudata TaxID=314043 RepID=A0AA39WWM9_9PEZI|nr:hypothetical protein B0T14DRAFT_601616 [Immersiella caudata]
MPRVTPPALFTSMLEAKMDLSLEETTSVAFQIRTDEGDLLSWTSSAMLISAETTSSAASDAFKAVRTYFERTPSLSGQERKLVTGTSSLERVQQVLAERVAVNNKSRNFLYKISKAVEHHATILKVFEERYPEYAALVWGIFSLVLSSVSAVNHAETLQLVAKSTAEIAHRLPRIKSTSQLHLTKGTQLAIENLCCCILEYLLNAHLWCSQYKFRHFHQGFARSDNYDELLRRITDCSNTVAQLVICGSQAEINFIDTSQARELHDVLNALETADKEREDQRRGLTQVVSLLRNFDGTTKQKMDHIFSILQASGQTVMDLLAKTNTLHYLHASTGLDTSKPLQNHQLTEIISSFSNAFEDPETTLRYHLFLRNWRATRMGAGTSTNKFWLSPKLQQWSSSYKSSMVTVKGPFKSRQAILDFGTSVIQALVASSVPTVWALKGTENAASAGSKTLAPTELVEYLTYQVLRLTSKALATTQTDEEVILYRSQFHDAKTLGDWFAHLKKALNSFSVRQVYLVVDLAAVSPDSELATNFIQGLHETLVDSNSSHAGSTRARIKVLLLLYEADWYGRLPKEVHDEVVLVKAMNPKNSDRQRKAHHIDMVRPPAGDHVFPREQQHPPATHQAQSGSHRDMLRGAPRVAGAKSVWPESGATAESTGLTPP